MKKLISFFFAMSLAALFCVSCDNDNPEDGGNNNGTTDNRANVLGEYPVKVSIESLQLELYPELVISKEGDSDLRAATTVAVDGVGSIDISIALSSLAEYDKSDGESVTGYYFNITGQTISVLNQSVPCEGTGIYEGGYDGTVYKNSSKAYFHAQINAMEMIINIESGTRPVENSYAEHYGKYVCGFSYYDSALEHGFASYTGGIVVSENSSADGVLLNGQFKYDDSADYMLNNFALSDMVAYETDKYEGYAFSVAEQTIYRGSDRISVFGNGKFEGGKDGLLLIGNDGSKWLIFDLDVKDTDQRVSVASNDVNEMFGLGSFKIPVNISGGSIDEDLTADISMQTDGNGGFVMNVSIDASSIGVGDIRFSYYSDNSVASEVYHNIDGSSLDKDVLYTVDMSSKIEFGQYGEVEFESLGQWYYDVFGYENPFDVEIRYHYVFPTLEVEDFYFFFGAFGNVAGFESGAEILIGIEGVFSAMN